MFFTWFPVPLKAYFMWLFNQSTPEYFRVATRAQAVDYHRLDSNWKRGVEDTMTYLKDGQESM
jgi:hypothetical protein